jgi:hypothetical protein
MALRLGPGTSNAQAGDARRAVRNAVERASLQHRAIPGQQVFIPRLTVRVPRGSSEATIAAAVSTAMTMHSGTRGR